ncbi:NYN domain-containing protein [Micromonospora sp. WMMD967]|uniref:NYN domain-containing protein n=1 Tax=Micromonospora sp. WMMD967 TaxID=3016101 RepID=UPI002416525C|nr:NYN domain-containing protein [Micromonospora sp. WMMD967]MDG4835776.1 NYN domain-containing protein [Micromonospora sp. WMMD967]
MATVAAYIDGFNLYYGMKNKYGRKHMWLDVVELVRKLRPKDTVTGVHYFSAIVKNEPAAAQNQTSYIDAMKIRNGGLLTVHLGRFKERTIKDCRRCGQSYSCGCGRQYRSFEEKGTDVALGAMMVADAALRIADTTLLISADTDLAPALSTVRAVNPSQRIYLAMPPGNTKASSHLTSVGDLGQFFIREQALRDAQLPNIVADPATGRSYTRPAKWS